MNMTRFANGILSKNEREKGPPYDGKIEVPVESIPELVTYLQQTEPVAGKVLLDVGAWIRERKDGSGKFFSLALSSHYKAKQRGQSDSEAPF